MRTAHLVAICLLLLSPRFGLAKDLPGNTATTAAEKELQPHINSLGMKFVKIPAGEFEMGSGDSHAALAAAFPKYDKQRIANLTDEYPRHNVRITKPFYFGQYEVTIGQFKQFVKLADFKTEPEQDGTGGWGYNQETHQVDQGRRPYYSWKNPGFVQGDDHPVVNITWNDAVAFCQWLSKKEGKTYRLPREAEWEYAARAGSQTRYFFGDDPEKLAGFANTFDHSGAKPFPEWQDQALAADDHFQYTAPVGSFKPNPWGLYDMHGNAWEWTADRYGEDYYAHSPTDDPTGPTEGHLRVRRGGCWHSWPLYCRISFRNWNTPKSRYINLGMRVVLEAD